MMRLIGCLVYFCIFAYTISVNAAQPIKLHRQNLRDLPYDIIPAVGVNGKQLSNRFQNYYILNERRDKAHTKHTRLQQHYAGFPVSNGYIVAHTTKSKKTYLSGIFYRNLKEDLGDIPPNFSPQADKALEHFKRDYTGEKISKSSAKPMVYIDEQHQAFWAYEVMVAFEQNGIPKQPMAILDAKTLKPFIQWDHVRTALTPVKGRGFGGNKLTGSYTYGEEYPLLKLLRDDSMSLCYMENEHVKLIDMGHRFDHSGVDSNFFGRYKVMQFHCYAQGRQADGSFWTGRHGDGYDLTNGAFSPGNDALFFAGVVIDLYRDWYDETVLVREDGHPMKLVMRLHYGIGYENAFWDGEKMTFGDGASEYYPMVSLDIVAHEVSHGFTQQHAGLNHYGQPAAINEAFSDMAAQAASVYLDHIPNWAIGRDVMKKPGSLRAMRFMDNPTIDGESIDHVDQYESDMDPHFAAGVYNRLFYLLAVQFDWGVRNVFHIMLKANMDYWTPASNFEDAGCGILYAANDLDYATQDVESALQMVGIHSENCSDKVPASS